MTVRRGQGGFTLVEVLVAFVILALLLSGFLSVFSTGLRSVRSSEDHVAAVRLAEARLTTIGAEAPLAEGVETGLWKDRYRWTTEIGPFEPQGEATGTELAALRIRVTVDWEEAGKVWSVVLETLRLMPGTSDDQS